LAFEGDSGTGDGRAGGVNDSAAEAAEVTLALEEGKGEEEKSGEEAHAQGSELHSISSMEGIVSKY